MREVRRALVLLLALSCLALQITPEHVTVEGGPGTDFQEVFSIINDQARPVEVQIQPAQFSTYLNDAATISDERYFLLPQETRNLQVRGTVPALGPETHHLRYEVREQGRVLGTFSVDMPIQGTPSLEPGISVDALDAVTGTSLSADATLSNFGNVIAYYNLTLAVQEAGRTLDTITYPQPVQVLPGEQKEISLVYTGFLEPGSYQLQVRARVNDEKTVQDSDAVRVTLAEDKRQIAQGDDLVVQLKRYETRPRIQYQVTGNGEELTETLVADEDELIVPTATLSPGTYDVRISVTHQQGTDTQQFELVIEESAAVPGWLAWLLGGLALLSAFLSRKMRLIMRLYWLSIRVHLREKRLNRLIYRAHELERRYGS